MNLPSPTLLEAWIGSHRLHGHGGKFDSPEFTPQSLSINCSENCFPTTFTAKAPCTSSPKSALNFFKIFKIPKNRFTARTWTSSSHPKLFCTPSFRLKNRMALGRSFPPTSVPSRRFTPSETLLRIPQSLLLLLLLLRDARDYCQNLSRVPSVVAWPSTEKELNRTAGTERTRRANEWTSARTLNGLVRFRPGPAELSRS